MNISDKSAKRECTSCQMCAAVCSKNAISIVLNTDGYYRPIVDENTCIDCGLCTKVCYKFDNEIGDFGQDRLAKTSLYGAFAKDNGVVYNTTSGGIADLLARELIFQGYKCVGVVYDSAKDKPVDYIASNVDETFGFRGSKYVQSYTLDAFKKVVKTCRNEKYAIFGTPCHIYAIDKYLRQCNVRDNHILIDLFCHGCPSMNVWNKYVKEVKRRINQPKIDNANFRSKIRGWGSFYVVVVVDGKPVYYSDNRHNEFFELFFSDQILNDACNDCRLRSTLDYTDIRLGDFWGKRYVLNNKGVSAVSLVTENAKSLFGKIADKVYYTEEQYGDFLPWQSWGKCHHPNVELRKVLLEQLQDDDITLRESINTIYHQQTIRRKIALCAKKIVQSMPLYLEKRVRWLFYKL